MTTLTLTKHHGLGNDFLVLLDAECATEVTQPLVIGLCDRREGIGADGLLHVVKPGRGTELGLTVWNADGSTAETSGNGLRCMAQAAVDAGLAPTDMVVITGGATRQVQVSPETSPGLRQVAVGMGTPVVTEEGRSVIERLPAASVPATRAARVDTGNPHLVAVVDDLRHFNDGFMRILSTAVNLEVIRVIGTDIEMRVWERGVGETRACGSGSVAAAAAARGWGMVGDRVTVHNPGGPVHVALDADGEAVLTGPAKFIGRVEVDTDRIST